MTDLFTIAKTPATLDQAKEVFRRLPKTESGMHIGCTTILQRGLGCSFTQAWAIMDELVKEGFISVADDLSRRVLLEDAGQIACGVSITNEEMAAGP